MSFEDSEKAARVTLQQHYNFVMNQAVSITYDLWHIIFMKILLIEDNQRTQEWVTQGLSEAGYVIDAVSDGRDGLYLALKDDYALIILDIMLPGMDGWQILQTELGSMLSELLEYVIDDPERNTKENLCNYVKEKLDL